MVWIPSSNLPAHEPDRFEQGASKESLLEKADEREDLESNEADVPNDPKSSMTVLDLPEVTPSESDPNLSGVVNQQNAITNPSLVSPSSSCNNNDRKPRITELMTKEQKQMIEQYYKIDMSIVDKEKVQSHMTVREKANIECNICSFKYSRRDKCEVHIWGHFNMKPYQCTACIFATVTLSNIRCHIRKNHLKLKPYLCQQCTKRYTSSVLLQEHMNTHTGARPYKCGECNFASSSRQALSNHKDTHKLNNNLPCSVCNKSFSSRVRLRAHKRIHNANRIMCELCRVHLLSEKALEEHRKKVHSQDYICNVCQKTFKSRKALHNHMNVHAEAKYKCNICLNTYKSKHILSEHILKHEGIRKYNCSVCDKTFAQMSHLAAHKKVHGSPGYKCEGCKREFNRRDNMKIHMKRCVACKALPA
ncbi:hypothetical protein X777_10735 [Ooceraea biroi]|uniref:C2H2-type domain-containing protein n=2 Tax=Ooceraea biroi TaxID=2015173 RepID=A0A026W392_OOCBI|nr:hypothetical protein X777_10735 [Ooceraea biroi]